MNSHARHAFASVALLASFALGTALPGPSASASAPQQGNSPIERLNQLEQRVAELNEQVAKLEGSTAKPSETPVAKPVSKDVSPKVAELEKQLQGVMMYLSSQAEGAKRLGEVLEDSRAKGFTYGINPDSRSVLLSGFGEFARTLQSNVPADERGQRVARPGR